MDDNNFFKILYNFSFLIISRRVTSTQQLFFKVDPYLCGGKKETTEFGLVKVNRSQSPHTLIV